MESVWRGLSGMDAVPLECRWSERTPGAQRSGPDAGERPFGSFWGYCQKEPAQQGGINAAGRT